MKKTNLKSIVAVAIALVFCLTLIACGQKTENLPEDSSISSGGVLCLKVNPEIAVTYDADGNVTGLNARNEDAKKIIDGYTGYEGKPCKEVVSELVTKIGDAGYFVEEIEGERRQITIEIESGSSLPSDAFLDDVANEVRASVNSRNWTSPVDVRGESDFGITDYIDTDYGPDNDGVTDYTDYAGNSKTPAQTTAPADTKAPASADTKAPAQTKAPADTTAAPVKNGVTDYNDTDYGPNNDGVTDYNDTDYGPNNDGVTDYNNTDYGVTDYKAPAQTKAPAETKAPAQTKAPAETKAPADTTTAPVKNGATDYKDTDYGPNNDGVTDYNDTDYGPNNDGVTDYNNTDYGPNNDGITDYGKTDYGATNYDDGKSDYGNSDYDD